MKLAVSRARAMIKTTKNSMTKKKTKKKTMRTVKHKRTVTTVRLVNIYDIRVGILVGCGISFLCVRHLTFSGNRSAAAAAAAEEDHQENLIPEADQRMASNEASTIPGIPEPAPVNEDHWFLSEFPWISGRFSVPKRPVGPSFSWDEAGLGSGTLSGTGARPIVCPVAGNKSRNGQTVELEYGAAHSGLRPHQGRPLQD